MFGGVPKTQSPERTLAVNSMMVAEGAFWYVRSMAAEFLRYIHIFVLFMHAYVVLFCAVCMYTCVCMYARLLLYIHVFMHAPACMYSGACMYVCLYEGMGVCMYARM